ncbi:MAG: hypothetical protein AAF513_10500, partial [Pseudomonadota bacterium]
LGMGIATYGIPLALLGASLAFFLAYGTGGASFWTPVGFLIASAGVLGYAAWVRDPERLNRHFLFACGIACPAVVLLRLATGGAGWFEALAAGQSIIVTVDLLLLLGGAAMLYRHRAGALAPLASEAEAAPVSAG